MKTPAEIVIAKFGGAQTVAEIVGRDVSNVHRWKYPRSRGGQGGLVPAHYAQSLLRAAAERGIPLVPEDFFKEMAA